MPGGKPAMVRCAQLTPENRCALFGRPERPAVCASLRPSLEMCGASDAEALANLAALELATTPAIRLEPARPPADAPCDNPDRRGRSDHTERNAP
jgi:hypothetical protein